MKRRVIVNYFILQKPAGGIAVLPTGSLTKKKKDIKNENEKENHNDLNKSDVINDSSQLESIDEKLPAKKDAKKKDKKGDKSLEKPEKTEKEKKEKIKVSLLDAINSVKNHTRSQSVVIVGKVEPQSSHL